jgi:hypothetical protein
MGAAMTQAPTPADVAQALVHHMMQTQTLSESHTAWCERFTHEIAQALAAARAEGVAQANVGTVAAAHTLGWLSPAERVALQARVAGLEAALQRYGHHDEGCQPALGRACGLDAALDGAAFQDDVIHARQASVLALEADKDVLMEQGESIAQERDALQAERTRLLDALTVYGRHDDGCPGQQLRDEDDCSCGLDRALLS